MNDARAHSVQREPARVLVVEDESLVAMMLADMLSDLGCTVVGPFGARAEALRAVTDGAPLDLALLDVNLGGDSVYDIAEALKLRNVPYAFVSGYGAGGIDSRHAHAPVLAKPIEPSLLERVVCGILGTCGGSAA
jgi:CheY-like chemotaxis protein